MLGTILAVVGGFALLVRRSYRASQARGYEPEGLRWTEDGPAR